MRIAALVHPVLKGRIREAMAPGDLFLDARSWDDLSEIAATRQVDLAVIDPAACERSAISAAANFASAFPVLPILVYTVASPTTAETLMKPRVYHALHSAGLGSPKRIFIVARLLNAYSRLCHSEDSVKRVAQELGYTNPRVLGLHSRAALAVTPRRLRNVSQDELIERLDSWVVLPTPESSKRQPSARTAVSTS